jgi:hypothetical protein
MYFLKKSEFFQRTSDIFGISTQNNVSGSFTIIPQNVHGILTDATFEGREVRANNEPVFKGTFAESRGRF